MFAIVKFISVIMVLIVLSLSIKPCCAVTKKNNFQSITLLNTSSNCCESSNCEKGKNNQNQNNKPEKDICNFCSPFFTCGSCIGFPHSQNSIHVSPLFFEFKKVFYIYSLHFNSECFGRLWQPPKIS